MTLIFYSEGRPYAKFRVDAGSRTADEAIDYWNSTEVKCKALRTSKMRLGPLRSE